MKISPDQYIVWNYGFVNINYTLIFTWIVMGLLISVAFLTRHKIKKNKGISKLENFFDVLILTIEEQIKNISDVDFKIIFPIITTIFLFIFTSNLSSLIPNFESPTASLSTTAALTILVIILAVFVGIKNKGFFGYFSKYTKPVAFMLPLNILGDIVSNFSLAFRLYGNIMSGGIIAKILVSIPFLSIGFPVIISLLGTITGAIQAYIFSILAMIFIASD